MAKNWKLKPEVPKEFLSEFPKFSAFEAQLLYNRGLTDLPKIKDFLDPKYSDLPSPFLFRDMEKAVARIWQAIDNKEKICIYGDYDADAVTANAVLQQTFRALNVKAVSYIPDRFAEGYGVNLEAMEKIKNDGCQVVITVDCGTNSVDAADFCKANNIDFIITDHHEIVGPKPGAFALINPKNPDDSYPFHEITGVGVAFKLACAMLKSGKGKVGSGKLTDGWEKWLLDLVAIGTVADCHSLLGENRILVKFGLKVLAKTRWPGLRALMIQAGVAKGTPWQPRSPLGLDKTLDTYTLGFVIAPRLNAAGRLEHASIALDLLMKEDGAAAQQTSAALEEVEQRLEGINKRRQGLTESILSEAREQALLLQDRKVLVLMKEDWHKGVVGLVAGRIAEEFRKPTIVLSKEGDEATGSARTIGEFNVVEALKSASAHLLRFGGHQQAAGLTLKTAEYELFYKQILDYAEQHLADTGRDFQLDLEAEVSPRDVTLDTLDILDAFEPFGVGNPKPKFLVRDLSLTGQRLAGAAQQHLQLQFSAEGRSLFGILFNASDFAKSLKVGDTVDVAAELVRDGWNGRESVKLRIVDIRKKS